ncbi:MAG: ATP-dependent helicase [Lachnospiraceae bacterium]|nr:ATP-dependent helicase [Lachnospiraceae bacterium]
MPDWTKHPNQERAIRHADGPAMIIAGPGSGKTYVTIHRIKHLITHHGVDPAHILVVTFSKAAALEMQERFWRLFEPARPAVWFGTFHAVFYHILKQSTQYREYTIITHADKRKLMKAITRMHRRFFYIQEEDYDKLLAVISRMKNLPEYTVSCYDSPDGAEAAAGLIPASDIPLAGMSLQDLAFLLLEYQKYLSELQQMDFDDIILYCEALLADNKELLMKWQSRFQYILIDEFQDIAPGQYRVMRMLAAPHNNIFAVGDDDQSIYRFRGASPAVTQQFLKDYPAAAKILLNVNYRCHRQIVEASLKVVEENKERIVKTIEAAHTEGEGISCHIFETQEEEQKYLVQELKAQKEAHKLGLSAVICRTNYDCALWAQILEQQHIPCRMKEISTSRFDHFVIKDISAYLALAAGSRRRSLFLRIMNRPVRYIRRDSLPDEEVTEEKWKAYYKDMPAVWKSIDSLFRGMERISHSRPYLAIRYIRTVIGYDAYLTDRYGPAQAKDMFCIADEFQEFARPFASYEEMRRSMAEYGETLSRRREASAGASAVGPEKIELLTMHASKGLEYDHVYLPGCVEGTIPSKKAETEADLEEERRMFYVAMTRAKRTLSISAVKGKTGKDVPSRFLNTICKI